MLITWEFIRGIFVIWKNQNKINLKKKEKKVKEHPNPGTLLSSSSTYRTRRKFSIPLSPFLSLALWSLSLFHLSLLNKDLHQIFDKTQKLQTSIAAPPLSMKNELNAYWSSTRRCNNADVWRGLAICDVPGPGFTASDCAWWVEPSSRDRGEERRKACGVGETQAALGSWRPRQLSARDCCHGGAQAVEAWGTSLAGAVCCEGGAAQSGRQSDGNGVGESYSPESSAGKSCSRSLCIL